jgi:DNA-binding protein YbaB
VTTELFAQLAEGFGELAADLRAQRDALRRNTGTATSPAGLITVTVTGRGELLDLWLAPEVFAAPDAGALADAIVRTSHAAAEQANR